MTEDDIRTELARLAPALRARLDASGFDEDRLVKWAERIRARAAGARGLDVASLNRVQGAVELPGDGDILDAPAPHGDGLSELEDFGRSVAGKVAFCVMAGGMATRMGGVVKALVDALPSMSFLDLRLRENATWSSRASSPLPMWIMTSDATDGPIREALRRRNAPPNVATFSQDLSLRLSPEGALFRNSDGSPSLYATGHGDLPDALRRSGLLHRFVDGGGQFVWIANVDNLGATIDLALLGRFAQLNVGAMIEVAPKREGDRGGIPAWARVGSARSSDERKLQVLEEFRLPPDFDASRVSVFNTNTILVRADALLRSPFEWTWYEVVKTVEGRPAIQFERLLHQLATAVPTAFVRVPRDGVVSRFLPVKDFDELAARREEISMVARARGML